MERTGERVVDTSGQPVIVAGSGVRELISADAIAEREDEMGRILAERYQPEGSLYMLTVLEGGIPFARGLSSAISRHAPDLQIQQATIGLQSYEGTQSTGNVTVVSGDLAAADNKNVLVTEDIIETGTTMAWLVEALRHAGAKSVEIAVLLHKNAVQSVHAQTLGHTALYVGFEIGPAFVIGYGLDYDGAYRDLPAIYERYSDAAMSS
jgi:hypoxanthine phosphoribosyltransferase